MPSRNQNLTDKFNERLGNLTGNKAVNAKPTRLTRKQIRSAPTVNLSKALIYGDGPKNPPKKEGIPNPLLADNASKVGALLNAIKNGEIKFEVEKKGGGGIGGFLSRNILQPAKKIGSETLERGGDLLSRPQYAVMEGTRRFISDSADEGNPFTSLDDVAFGVSEGLGGWKKTGFGDVGHQVLEDLDHIPNPSFFPAREYAEEFFAGEDDAPLTKVIQNNAAVEEGRDLPYPDLTDEEVAQAQDQAKSLGYLGLTGNLVLDPINLVGGGAVSATRKGLETVDEVGDTVKGVEAARTVGRKVSRDVVKGVEESLPARGRNLQKQSITKAVVDALDRSTVEIAGGRNTRRIIGANPVDTAAAAQAGALKYRDFYNARLDKGLAELERIREAGNLDRDALAILYKRYPELKIANDEAVKIALSQFKDGKVAKAIKAKKMAKAEAIAEVASDIRGEAIAAARSLADEDVKNVYTKIKEGLDAELIKRPGINLFGKEYTIGGKKLWTSAASVGQKVGKGTLGRILSHERTFPGLTSAVASGARTSGIQLAEYITRDFLDDVGRMTSQQDELIQRALQSGEKLSGEEGQLLEKFRNWYDSMWQLQTKGGLESAEKLPNKNYAYTYFKGDNKDVQDARELRKKLLEGRDPKLNQDDWYRAFVDSSEAKKVKPLSKSARQNFIYHVNDVMRQAVRQEARQRIIEMYGVKSADLSEAFKRSVDVKLVPKEWLTPALKGELAKLEQKVGRGKGDWYLPTDAYNILEEFNKWARNGLSPETSNLLRGYDRIIRFIKSANTIPFPAYHVRNMFTDYITGSMDGVKARDWLDVAELEGKLKGIPVFRGTGKYTTGSIVKGPNPGVTLKIGNEDILYSRLKAAYKETAGSTGFYRTDLPFERHPGTLLSGGPELAYRNARAAIRSGTERFKSVSQGREDWGRLAHFKHAMTEEYPKALKTYKNENKAWEMASQASAFRVNKYHADYGALTNFEQKAIKRAIPFYTYSRRMIPVMAESMLLNPSYWTIQNKLQRMSQNLVGEQPDPAWYAYPEWMNEMGYTPFNDSDWGIAAQALLPAGIIKQWVGSSPRETVKNIVQSGTPPARVIGDWVYGQDLYTGRDNTDLVDILKRTLRPYTTSKTLTSGSSSGLENTLRTILGLPVYEMTPGRKNSARYEVNTAMYDAAEQIDDQLRDIGYGFYISQGNTVKVVKRDSKGEIEREMYAGPDMQRALAVVAQIVKRAEERGS